MRRHRFDPFSFVFGVTFVAVALYILLGGSLAEIPSAWAIAIPTLIVATLLVLYAGRQLFSRGPTPGVEAEDDPDPDVTN